MIMPDIEKRLEAFVRLAHGIVVFPGGAGTAEEILYLLGILLDPANARAAASRRVHRAGARAPATSSTSTRFIGGTLGRGARSGATRIIVDDPAEVARACCAAWTRCASSAAAQSDSYNFNWLLPIPPEFQQPFEVTHEACARSTCGATSRCTSCAANLRRAFSGIVTGNVKEQGIRRSRQQGPFEIRADEQIAKPLDELLRAFVAQRRMNCSANTSRATASSECRASRRLPARDL